ncbi:hypothetical protein [Pantoea sp. FN0307]|uniref:hypothetical protein n=1 Tax=Pantoea sp. FN0307 TaxID=3418560 RepID=UPI003CE7148F
MIKDLNVIKDSGFIRWVNKGQSYNFDLSSIDQAMVDESRQLIFILSGCLSSPNEIHVLNGEGEVQFSSRSPAGSNFYYLTKTASNEVLVVCSFEEKYDNWYDWHYSFNVEGRELHRLAPSY